MGTGEKELMTVREVAELLRVGRTTLWRWRSEGVGPVPFELRPRVLRYRRAEVEAYLCEREGAR